MFAGTFQVWFVNSPRYQYMEFRLANGIHLLQAEARKIEAYRDKLLNWLRDKYYTRNGPYKWLALMCKPSIDGNDLR